jgi:hypothetical protein
MNHGQTQTHKHDYGLDLVGAIILLPVIYFTIFSEGWHSNNIFSHDFQLGIPKLSNYESYHHTFLVLIITENILRVKKCFENILPLTYQAPKLELIWLFFWMF